MGRSPCCSKEGMNRGAWTALEDKILIDYIKAHGEGSWRNLPKKAGLKRCGKSCRLRWLNYLRPEIKRGNISDDEKDLIIRLHNLLGNRWSLIAGRLPNRTDNEIKNYWNTNLVKKVQAESHQNSAPNHDKKKINQPIIDPPLIYTKAMRCTKPITLNYNPVPEKVDHQLDYSTNHEVTTVLDHGPVLRDISVDDLVDYGCSYNNDCSSIAGGKDDLPENFMMDLTMGDLRLSDLLNSEFSDFCDFNYTKNDIFNDNKNNPISSMPSPGHLEFSNEMLEDWALRDQNVASNLKIFSAFLDSEERDWLPK